MTKLCSCVSAVGMHRRPPPLFALSSAVASRRRNAEAQNRCDDVTLNRTTVHASETNVAVSRRFVEAMMSDPSTQRKDGAFTNLLGWVRLRRGIGTTQRLIGCDGVTSSRRVCAGRDRTLRHAAYERAGRRLGVQPLGQQVELT